MIIGVFFPGELVYVFEGTAEVVPDEFRFRLVEAVLYPLGGTIY